MNWPTAMTKKIASFVQGAQLDGARRWRSRAIGRGRVPIACAPPLAAPCEPCFHASIIAARGEARRELIRTGMASGGSGGVGRHGPTGVALRRSSPLAAVAAIAGGLVLDLLRQGRRPRPTTPMCRADETHRLAEGARHGDRRIDASENQPVEGRRPAGPARSRGIRPEDRAGPGRPDGGASRGAEGRQGRPRPPRRRGEASPRSR